MSVRMTHSISSSCSLHSHSEEPPPPQDRNDLFGSDSEEELAASRAESAKAEDTEQPQDRAKILPCQLEPPAVGFNEDGVVLPSEFELVDPLELSFPYEKAQHPTKDVSLFTPGELLDVELELFDETASNGYVEDGSYQKRVIRWREKEGNVECNSRVVEWDDGTVSFYVEGKWYDVGRESFAQGTELLCIDQGNCYQALHAVETGMVTVVAPDESEEESDVETMTESPELRKPKTKRVTVLVNPVKEREMKLKRIEEERRDRELMERKQRNLQEKYSLPSNLDGYDFEEEEETGHEVEIPSKRTRPTRYQPARAKKHRLMDDVEEEAAELDEEGEPEEEEDIPSESRGSSEEEEEKGASSGEAALPVAAPQEQALTLNTIVVPVTQLFGMDEEYRYIRSSIQHFPKGRELERLALDVGFRQARHYLVAQGLMGLLVAQKNHS